MCEELHDHFEDQVACARYRAERDALAQAVQAVCERMEGHCLGVEGMDDSPVASWTRDLRAALGSLHAPGFQKSRKVANLLTPHSGASDTTMSTYDLLSEEDRRAITWVCKHGGIAEVERKVAASMEQADDYIALRCSLAERAGDLYDMLDKSDDELIALLDERLKRPAPKVLDADGVEIHEKCDAWWICEGDERGVHAERLRVETIGPDGLIECSPYNGGTWVYLEPSELYVNKPVPASDGKPLREGETVWGTGREEHEYVVLGQPGLGGGAGRFKVVCHDVTDDVDCDCDPSHLTHERPEIDSWERLEEDATRQPYSYCVEHGLDDDDSLPTNEKFARDLVRRARALAGDA